MQAKEKANEARMFSENQKLGKESVYTPFKTTLKNLSGKQTNEQRDENTGGNTHKHADKQFLKDR